MIAIACAVATGPLLAHAAIGIRDYVSSAPDDEGFSLDGGVFIDPRSGGGLTASQGCDEPWISCVVTGGGGDDWWPGGGGLGGGGTGGGSSGGDCSADPSRCEDGNNDQHLSAFGIGIEGSCFTERATTSQALGLLYQYSPTARGLIEAMANRGTDIRLISALADGEDIAFDDERNKIQWDPYVVIRGINEDGSEYRLSPLMTLAHELVHAGNYGLPGWRSEPNAMQLANQIATELNTNMTNAGIFTFYNTNRDNHERTGLSHVTNYLSDNFTPGASRPTCTQ